MSTKDARPASSPASHGPPARVDEYEIVRPLGRGAMGQVFQAVDTLLGRQVAVKFIASAQPNQLARERFLVEARAIARLQHPNVLSIYRVGIAEGRPYIASEFVSGKSLDKLPLPLPWRRTLEIALQLSRGLASAHRQSVLHRDIKPANVMVTEEGVAKLLDFGLAKLTDGLTSPALGATGVMNTLAPPVAGPGGSPDRSPGEAAAQNAAAGTADTWADPASAAEAQARPSAADRVATLPTESNQNQPSSKPSKVSLTAPGSLLGTPSYMAPEVWRGERASAASDVYSFGAMLFELCQGRPPHDCKTVEQLGRAVVDKDARPLASLAPSVDGRLAAIVDRCLRRDASSRFASGEELQKALEELSAELQAPTVRALLRKAIRRRWPVALVIALLLLVPPGIALKYFYQLRAAERRAAAAIKNRRSIAVLGLQTLPRSSAEPGGQSSKHAGFAAAFAELLGRELSAGERLRRLPADSVTQMKIELDLGELEQYDPATLLRLHRGLGCDLFAAGSVQAEESGSGKLRVLINIQDAKSGKVLASVQKRGSSEALFEIITRTGAELRQQLGLAGLSAAEEAALIAGRPSSPQVATLYAQGQEKLRRFDAVGARQLLEQALAVDSEYALGHLALAEAFTALGYDKKAEAAARQAFKLSENLPREDRFRIEARFRKTAKQWDKAIALYQSLLTFFPESLDYGLALASVQLDAGQPEASRGMVRKLRQLPAPANQDPRLDILEARATEEVGDAKAALILLERAIAQGASIGTPLVIARAHLEAAYAYSSLGQQERSMQSAAAAKPIFLAAGDKGTAADSIMAISLAYLYLGNISRALETAQEASELLLEIENRRLAVTNLCNMSIMAIKRGNLDIARARAEGCLLLAREIDVVGAMGLATISLGLVSMLQGKLEKSMIFFRQAESSFNSVGNMELAAWAYWHIGQNLFLRDDLVGARKYHETALAIREQNRLQGYAAESRAALAALALEEQKPAVAAELAQRAAEQFAKEQQGDQEAEALALLAEALVRQNRTAEAQIAMTRAIKLAADCQNKIIRLFVLRKKLMLELENKKLSKPDNFQHELMAGLAEAKAADLLVEELELRLIYQRFMLTRNQGKGPRSQDDMLAQEASQSGLRLIAKKAKSALPQ